MAKTIRLEAPSGKEDEQEVADAITARLDGAATVRPRRRPSGSLNSIDPTTQSFIVDILNSDALHTTLELIFGYFILRKAKAVKIDDLEIKLEGDPKESARTTAERVKRN